MKKLAFSLLAALACAALPSARAAILITAPTTTTTGSLQITAPFTLTISTAGDLRLIALQNLVATGDGTDNASIMTPALAYSINGVAQANTATALNDNIGFTYGSINPRDGYLNLALNPLLAVNDKVTIQAGTYVLSATNNYNPLTTGTFTGGLFVADDYGTRISDIVPAGVVPEPGTWALVGVGAGLLGVVTLRQRRTCRA